MATDGAHAEIEKTYGFYILPMCHACNTARHFGWMNVKVNVVAVRLLSQDTSGPGNCWRLFKHW